MNRVLGFYYMTIAGLLEGNCVKKIGFSTASLLLGVSVLLLNNKFGLLRHSLSIWGAKLGDLYKTTKKMTHLFTYIILIFNKIQYYSELMHNYKKKKKKW